MPWSWQIAKVAGIPIRVHATFGFLIAWIFFMHLAEGESVGRAAMGAALVLAVFGCVVLHEFGHALTARRYGIRTRDITLLPIGGVARLERIPERPIQEILVALAGPAVNVVIAGILYGVLALGWKIQPSRALDFRSGFLGELLLINVVLAVFNMVPAFPMDGGRVLRALLATRFDYVRATRIAANIGQGMAVLIGIAGLRFGAPMVLLVALFVFLGAGQEAAAVQMRSAFAGVPVSRAMIRDFRTLRTDEPLSRAVELLLDGHQQDFPILGAQAGDPSVGILTRSDLLTALAEGRTDRTVGEVARRNCGIAHPREYLEDVFLRMESSGCPALAVVSERGDVVGMLTLENVGELAMIHTALGRARERGGPGRSA